MINLFELGAQELRAIDDQRAAIDAVAEATDNPIAKAGAEALAVAQHEHYLLLCEIVNQNPSLAYFYGRALQRVKVVMRVVEAQGNIEGLDPETQAKIGGLALDAATETPNLLAFFQLFAPDDPVYKSYIARNSSADDSRDGLNTRVFNPVPPVALIGEGVGPATPRKPTTPTITRKASPLPAPDGGNETTEVLSSEVIRIDGKIAPLNKFQSKILALYIKLGGKNIKSGSIVNDPQFIALVDADSTKGIKTTGGYAQRYRLYAKELNELFPGILYHNGKDKGGRRWSVSDDYTIEVIADTEQTFDEISSTAAVDLVASPTEAAPVVAPEPPIEEPHDTPDNEVPLPVVSPRGQGRRGRPVSRGENGICTEKLNDGTRLMATGYCIGNKYTAYTSLQFEALQLINASPRKDPLSEAQIFDALRAKEISATKEEIEAELCALAQKLPNGWLVKVASGKDKPDGWRFGKRIRIRQ